MYVLALQLGTNELNHMMCSHHNNESVQVPRVKVALRPFTDVSTLANSEATSLEGKAETIQQKNLPSTEPAQVPKGILANKRIF